MPIETNVEGKKKHYPKFANFGEYLFYSYGLSVLCKSHH